MNNKCYRILLSGRAPEISINRNGVHRNLRRKTFLITLLFNRERKLCVALPTHLFATFPNQCVPTKQQLNKIRCRLENKVSTEKNVFIQNEIMNDNE